MITKPLLFAAALALTMSSCSTLDRSLVFTTHTTQGLEISSQGTTSEPVTIVLGYKRTEAVLNPVYDESGIEGDGSQKYRDSAYSVLAKFVGEIKGEAGPSGSIQSSQWFATGEAATQVARNEGVAAALTDGKAKDAGGGVGDLYDSPDYVHVADQLGAVYSVLDAAHDDAVSDGHVAALNGLTTLLPASYPFDFYAGDPSVAGNVINTSGNPVGPSDFQSVTSYLEELTTSIDSLKTHEAAGNASGIATQAFIDSQVDERARVADGISSPVLGAIQYAQKRLETMEGGD